MKQSRKICVFTGTRADYGLLRPLIVELSDADDFELQLLVSGSHLSSEYGLTYREIEGDGFNIDAKCEILLSTASLESVAKATGLGLLSFSTELARMEPDGVVILGDRYEALACAASCLFMKIPVIHFHGGETTEGAFDESIRHSITKMSHLHFTATEGYRERVLQLGEKPSNVYALGAIGIDSIVSLDLLERKAFCESIAFELLDFNMLVTFHPVTLGEESSEKQMQQILRALDAFPRMGIIFTMPNADSDSRSIMLLIEEYCSLRENAICFKSMGQLRYLSALKHVDVVVGNSSSGLLEAPSFAIPTVNIGDRQKGRDSGVSVVDCETRATEIITAIESVMERNWRDEHLDGVSIYGDGNVAKNAIDILRKTDLSNLLQKKFYSYHG